jgi:cell division protein FtsL
LFFLKDYAKRVDAAGANLLLFIAFNFTISSDLPRLGYLTFLDTLLISAFLLTAVVLVLSVYLARQDMKGRQAFVAKVDRYVITLYPLAYIATIATVDRPVPANALSEHRGPNRFRT